MMAKNIKSVGVLVAICTVVALLLALTNQITAPIIKKNEQMKAAAALREVMPEGTAFEKMDLGGYTLPGTITEVHKETEGKGYVIKMTTTGYGPNMVIMCGVTTDGVVTGAQCLSSNETLGEEKAYGNSFKNKDAAGVDATDTVSGATMTTKAYKNAVKDALNAAIILGGGEADLRTDEEKFNDNLKAALPAADEFVKQMVADHNAILYTIYAAKNGAGYVYVLGDHFIGIDAEGKVTTEGILSDTAAEARAIVDLAKEHVAIDIADSGINENITSVQKNAEGNYVIEINGLGFGWFGDPEHYQPAKNIPIKICTVVSPDGKMLECLTVSHQESGGYGAVCGEESYYGQFDGKTIDNYQDVDIVGSPTYKITNNGYLKAIQRCFEAVAILEGGAEQ